MAAKKTDKKKTAVDKQRVSTGSGRDGAGRFTTGNAQGFKAGQSGNSTGRPKVRTLSEHLRDRLKEQYPGRSVTTYGRMVAEALVTEAIDGNVQAIREIFDRVEGKPKQVVDVNIEERKREMVEDAIARVVEEAQVSRDEAIEQLMAIAPEMSKWIN
ncbi:MAG TPA: DUF5681 domain-containing protein [Blastocatellia bacterium]|nr:DUF5681 domain-containing protein [Blastocatellia bacterium]